MSHSKDNKYCLRDDTGCMNPMRGKCICLPVAEGGNGFDGGIGMTNPPVAEEKQTAIIRKSKCCGQPVIYADRKHNAPLKEGYFCAGTKGCGKWCETVADHVAEFTAPTAPSDLELQTRNEIEDIFDNESHSFRLPNSLKTLNFEAYGHIADILIPYIRTTRTNEREAVVREAHEALKEWEAGKNRAGYDYEPKHVDEFRTIIKSLTGKV